MKDQRDGPGVSGGVAGGVSRRGFIKGVGGAVSVVALGAAAAKAQDGAKPTGPVKRNGLTTYPARGVDIQLNVNGKAQAFHVLPSATLLEVLARAGGADRQQGGVQPGRMRGVYRAAGRAEREQLPDAGHRRGGPGG